jgi:hypothetical protein
LKKAESKLYQEIKKLLPDVHFQRIETNVGLGVPDVNGCGDGVEFWLELKVSSNKQSSLSKYQKAWIIRRGRVGGRVFILQKTLRQRCLKLYGWPSAMAEEPFSTVPVAVFPFPVDARALKHAILHQGPAAGVKV